MRNGTTIGRGTIALYAAVNAVFSAVVAGVGIWAGVPLAAIPWAIIAIICASIAMCASIAREPVATPTPITVVTGPRHQKERSRI